MGEVINKRRVETKERLALLRSHVTKAAGLVDKKACVYLTGSFARLEANVHSDLDLFIVGLAEGEDRRLARLDEVLVKADLIEATRLLSIEDFSGDGQYLVHYTIDELIQTLGTPEDDATNTFTARLLLLLESRPLLSDDVYREVIKKVIAAYWKDFAKHKADFMPAFLANDILRLWRTFCINYEARTETDPPYKKAKRKIKNYKLKHSRLLTCYSALLYLLSTYNRQGTVLEEKAYEMTVLTPTERLEWLLNEEKGAKDEILKLLECYERFLVATDEKEKVLVDRFLQASTGTSSTFAGDDDFGDLMFKVMHKIGGDGSRFYRLLVV